MVNSKDKTMGSTGVRRANASMTERSARPLTEAAVEGGQMGCVDTQLGAQMRVDRLGGDFFSGMTGDIFGVFVGYTDGNMCDSWN